MENRLNGRFSIFFASLMQNGYSAYVFFSSDQTKYSTGFLVDSLPSMNSRFTEVS